jgi:hypothetical protein
MEDVMMLEGSATVTVVELQPQSSDPLDPWLMFHRLIELANTPNHAKFSTEITTKFGDVEDPTISILDSQFTGFEIAFSDGQHVFMYVQRSEVIVGHCGDFGVETNPACDQASARELYTEIMRKLNK